MNIFDRFIVRMYGTSNNGLTSTVSHALIVAVLIVLLAMLFSSSTSVFWLVVFFVSVTSRAFGVFLARKICKNHQNN